MGGYSGYSRSNNAVEAEERGLLPLSRITGAPRWAIKLAGELIGSVEWHHTSKYYNVTYYYNAERIVACALNLVKQFQNKRTAKAIIQCLRDERQDNKHNRGRIWPTKLKMDCMVWYQRKYCTGHTYREVIRLLRAYGPITVESWNCILACLAVRWAQAGV